MFEYYDDYYRQPPFSGMPFGQQPPPFGQQFGPPFGRPPFGPPGQQQQGGASGPPSGPPPSFTPQQSQAHGASLYAVDPGAIRRCMFRYVYIWLRNGDSFWAWLVFVGRRSVAGWRWTGRRWVYFGVDLRSIESFTCF